ncbi:MAG TPA: acyl-CoA synthetase FdrA [Candidatus Cybelea sp.]|nr:acyl-CoA synthetase FdrA [Candidatus Cybelea sp.]
MPSVTKVFRNFYRDSVSLMQLSARLAKLPGLSQASAVMASENNLALLREAGQLAGAVDAGPNDLLIVLTGDDAPTLEAAMTEAEAALYEKPRSGGGGVRQEPPRSLEMGLAALPAASLALISTPGDYAAAEAMKALRLGLNVLLFSDNVAIADEIELKRYAESRDLIVMGPDCGTAIINGIPLGFANVVRRGAIGVVGASGTGLQQVTCLIDRLGQGVAQAIGTGGHDLHGDVGGISMLQGLRALAADPTTRVIVLISKPPAAAVAARVLATARDAGKPVVVNFLGADPGSIRGPNLHPAKTLEDAAVTAVTLLEGRTPPALESHAAAAADRSGLAAGQRFVRGLYSGGTFCFEATMLLAEALAPVYSNTPVGTAKSLEDVWRSRGNTLLDLGDDVFTRGRPHPMIDHRLRNDRILAEAADPETAVILLDVVLGYGSHRDPAGEMAPVIEAARRTAARAGRQPIFVGFVCGTDNDPQSLARQRARLTEAGMRLAPSNAQAVRLAMAIAAPGEVRRS